MTPAQPPISAVGRGGLTGWRWQVGDKVFAHGKDMYYDGWEDTVQINYGHPKAREEMTKVACRVCVCGGVIFGLGYG